MLGETLSRRGVEVGRIRFVDGQRKAEPGEELPEEGAKGHASQARLGCTAGMNSSEGMIKKEKMRS